MSLFFATVKYRLKALCTGAYGIISFALALLVAISPFIGLIIPDAPVPIGWIDEDNTEFSALLLRNVQALHVVWVTQDDEDTLIANLQTGRLEGVFVIKDGFEDAIKNGEFEETLQLWRSPYSTAAGVISESVGGEAMRLWLSCAGAGEAEGLGGAALRQKVFADTSAGTAEPILLMRRQNAVGATDEVTPVSDAAFSSLYLLAALCCFFMLSGVPRRSADFALRLQSRAFSLARYRLAAVIADTAFVLPCVAVPLVALGAAGAAHRIAPLLAMFALYVLAFGGVASLVQRISAPSIRVLMISVITIANVMLGSMLIALPAAGPMQFFTYLLPSRWLCALDSLGAPACIAGLAACALVYNALPFLPHKKEA